MKRLNEIDYDVLELLQAAPEGLKFGEILEKTGQDVLRVHKCLAKLLNRNYVALADNTTYRIGEHNEHVTIRRVQCPICKTIKRIYNDTQESTLCSNPECIRKGGFRRQFWIISQHFQKQGITKRINMVE